MAVFILIIAMMNGLALHAQITPTFRQCRLQFVKVIAPALPTTSDEGITGT
jgi:hypothetical protein